MSRKYNPGIKPLLKKVIALASIDGGFVISVRILAFLCVYFSMRSNGTTLFTTLDFSNMLAVLINVINTAVITIRITGLNRGLKYPINICYQQAIKRVPSLLSLYILAGLALLLAALPITQILSSMYIAPLILVALFSFLPLLAIASSFIVDQEVNSLKAIIATYNLCLKVIDKKFLVFVMALYAIPMACFALLSLIGANQYIELAAQIWGLFCDIAAITIYAETSAPKISKKNAKNIKVFLA